MADEFLQLDPSEVATDRTALTIHALAGPIQIRKDGVDWGDAEMAAYSAELDRGEAPVDGRFPNRLVTIPLQLKEGGGGGVTFDQARRKLQAKVALFQREGGWLKRELRDGTKIYLDVVNATLGLGGHTFQAIGRFDNEIDLVLTTIPDWYGDEITLSDHTETSSPELIFAETGIKGDFPGRVRIVVDEDDADAQRGLMWGVRSRNYSSAATAALAYDSGSLTPLDLAGNELLTGAGGGTAVEHTNLGTQWTPVLSTQAFGGGAHMTHKGSYRVKARVYSTSTAETVQARFVWDVGDLTNPVENAPWEIPGASNFYIADLGESRLDPTTGTHRWQGQIQAKGTIGGENIYIDRLWFIPIDEAAGEMRAPLSTSPTSVISARDEFNQAAGALTGKTLPVGGTWAGAGDSDDFSVAALPVVQRTAVSDASTPNLGRFALAGTAVYSNIAARVAFHSTYVGITLTQAVLLRYVDTSNFVFAGMTGSNLVLGRVVAGSQFTTTVPFVQAPGTWYTLQVAVDAGGNAHVWCEAGLNPSLGAPRLSAAWGIWGLATGGALDDGRIGLYDWSPGSSAATRSYWAFSAWVPTADAVLNASQSAELSTAGMYREDSTGTAYGPVSHVTGDLPRIPPSGLEARSVQFIIKGSRGDLDSLPDSGIDNISARVSYRPSFLFAPEPA